jgi:WD40 repeat protein
LELVAIRAMLKTSINENYVVSAGSDKVIIVWDRSTGDRIVKFGQQPNTCMGIHLIDELVISVTVDGMVRVFGMAQKSMIGEVRITDLGVERDRGRTGDLKWDGDTRSRAGRPITWVESSDRTLVVSESDGSE